jgi:biotin carboxyl carrier protein
VRFEAEADGRAVPVEVSAAGSRFQVRVDDRTWAVDARRTGPGLWSIVIDGVSTVAEVVREDEAYLVSVGREPIRIAIEEAARSRLLRRGRAAPGTGQLVRAPMPGRVVSVAVAAGGTVVPGDALVVLEAMKMENELKATVDGTVKEVRVAPGQAVNAGDVMVIIA